jgi:hypothetical protein
VEALREGLWWWTAPHPEWTPEQGGPGGWQRDVSSYAFDCGETFVLVDPQSPPSLVDELAAGKRAAVCLTCAWHRRSADEVVERLGAHVHQPGEELPDCVDAKAGVHDGEAVLWIPAYGALVFGDAVIGEPDTIRIPETWLPEGTTRDAFAGRLRHLLELPVEHVLPTHGRPGTRVELEEALGS